MGHTVFEPQFFKITELKEKVGMVQLIENTKVPVTFNQLMKSEDAFTHIFVFDEKSIEVPSLIAFCRYFKIELYKLCPDDIREMKSKIKHSQIVCIPAGFPGTEKLKTILGSLKSTKIAEGICKIRI
ncbi:uncharacterized protein VICG_01279 [Vittaforma corneae ATCC 50505]|uniref:Uncharacterized protein n=1 Tax=Vittaforma corneae (strain ATCC 50505) TaxID=993615 RepID=L2GLC9_VITCO|nr:uncharacterized protein VICG_01279 [Vittaforma corneae ATCC 50505]ELA41646.1 hypothetical protein VICG_01279 [Vittaforma corneae ATCC 50505]